MPGRRGAARAYDPRRPRAPGPVRRRVRRLQPDPLERARRHVGRPARRHRARHVHHGRGRHASSPTGSATPARSSTTRCASPSRSSCPTTPGADIEVARRRQGARPRDEARHRRADRDRRRREGARPGHRRRGPRLSGPTRARGARRPPWPPSRRCGSAARPRGSSRSTTTDELVDAVREVDDADEPLLVVSGGSNLLVSDEGFAGTVVRVATTGRHAGVRRLLRGRLGAGRRGRGLGRRSSRAPSRGLGRHRGAVRHPRLAPGRRPIQNVGAYGQEVSQTIASVRTWDRREQAGCAPSPAATAASPTATRASRRDRRYVVLDVVFQLRARRPRPRRSRTPTWPARLGVALGPRVPLADAREAVLAQRRGRGMVLDADDHDTWSAARSSPTRSCGRTSSTRLVERARDGSGAEAPTPPRFAEPDGRVKTSAAWLIDQAGFGKGYGAARPGGAVDQAHPGPDQPRRRDARRRRWCSPARSATACRTAFGVHPRQRAGPRRRTPLRLRSRS